MGYMSTFVKSRSRWRGIMLLGLHRSLLFGEILADSCFSAYGFWGRSGWFFLS